MKVLSCLVLALVASALAAPVEKKEKKTEKRGILGLDGYGYGLGSGLSLGLGHGIGYSSLALPTIHAAPAYHAPIISAPAYHAPIVSAPAYHTPIISASAYHAPIYSAPAIHAAPIALGGYGHPW